MSLQGKAAQKLTGRSVVPTSPHITTRGERVDDRAKIENAKIGQTVISRKTGEIRPATDKTRKKTEIFAKAATSTIFEKRAQFQHLGYV